MIDETDIELNRFFSQECFFIAGSAKPADIPSIQELPEIAFAGRSNVGKSSLINALVNRRSLARISDTPGRTQQINFFSLGNQVCLVDLPGYGYAGVSKQVRHGWGELIVHYLETRSTLKRVFLLIDSRRGIKQLDEEMMDILEKSAVIFQVVLTKVDKPTQIELKAVIDDTIMKLKKRVAVYPSVITTSSLNKSGINQIRSEIKGFVQQP